MAATIVIQSDLAFSALTIFAVLMAAFLLFTHRSNIASMQKGIEYRFERAYFKNWFK